LSALLISMSIIPYCHNGICKECNLSFLLLKPQATLNIIGFVQDTGRLELTFGSYDDCVGYETGACTHKPSSRP